MNIDSCGVAALGENFPTGVATHEFNTVPVHNILLRFFAICASRLFHGVLGIDASVAIPLAEYGSFSGQASRITVFVQPLADWVGVVRVDLHRGVAQELPGLAESQIGIGRCRRRR